MLQFKEIVHINEIPKNREYCLAADIGGTNSNFGIFDINDPQLKLLVSIHFKSKEIKDFTQLILDLLNYIENKYHIQLKIGYFGAAGVISENRDYVKPTNLTSEINANEIKQKTSLKKIIIINDFEILAYGIDKIEKKDLVIINQGQQRKNATKAIIGAGTGVGKGILVWNEDRYQPIPSEGGHADFPIENETEFELIKFLRESEIKCRITWETVLSGNGIKRIYNFFEKTNKFKKTDISEKIVKSNYSPDEIFSFWEEDECCNATFQLYSSFYGRCAKNFALETLSLSGLYIAGGIAAKNLELFNQNEFINEFFACSKLSEIIKQIPLIVIADYNISLYGAAFKAQEEFVS